jgi:hypothetical protein
VAGVSLEVSEVMRVPTGGGVGNEVRKPGLVVSFVFVPVERLHLPKWTHRRRTSALHVWPLVM